MANINAKKGAIILSVLIIAFLFSACTTVPKNVLKDRIASLSDAELEEATTALSAPEPSGIVGFATKKSSVASRLGVVTSKDKEQAKQLVQQEQARRASASRDQTSAGRRGAQSSTIVSGSSRTPAKGTAGSSIGTLPRGAASPTSLPKGTLIQDLTRSRALKDDMMKVLADAGLSITSKTDQVMSGDLVSLPGTNRDSVFSQVSSLMGGIGSKADLLVFGDMKKTLSGGAPDMTFDFGGGFSGGRIGIVGSAMSGGWLGGSIKGVVQPKAGGPSVAIVNQGYHNDITIHTQGESTVVNVPSGGGVHDKNEVYICTSGSGCSASVSKTQINDPEKNGLCGVGSSGSCGLTDATSCNGVSCSPGYHCNNGNCVEGESDKEQCKYGCASDEVCQSNQCVKKKTQEGTSGSQCDPLVMDCGGGMQGPLDPNDPLVKMLKNCQNPGQVVVMIPNPEGGGMFIGTCSRGAIDTSSLVTKFGQQSQPDPNQQQGGSASAVSKPPWGRGDIDPERP